MNKEQIDGIALRIFDEICQPIDEHDAIGIENITYFAERVLDELAKGQEPVAWLQTSVEEGVDTVIARTHKPDKFNAEWWRFDPLYTHPLPQPDLVAEIEQAALKKAMQQATEVSKQVTDDWKAKCTELRLQLSAAQRERDICHAECIRITNDYNAKLSASQASEPEMLKALEEYVCGDKVRETTESSTHYKALAAHKAHQGKGQSNG